MTEPERLLQRAKSGFAHVLFRAWPFPFGLDRLMDAIDPLPPPGPVTRKLRGFPVRLTFEPSSYVGRFLYYRGMYEDATMEFLRRVARPGMQFLDVGANIGLHTTIAAKLVGPTGRVLAIEPQQDLCELIAHNVTQNSLVNVTIVCTAIGRETGSALLHQLYVSNPSAATLQLQPGEHGCSSTPVQLRTLADVVAEADLDMQDAIMKIDVEGAELEVLAGAERRLTERIPFLILVECQDHHLRRFGAGSVDLLAKLASLGYRLSTFHRGRHVQLDPARPVDAEVIAWRPERPPW